MTDPQQAAAIGKAEEKEQAGTVFHVSACCIKKTKMEKTCLISEYESLRLENQLCFSLYACAKEVTRQYRIPLKELNLTYTQYIVMMVLWEFGGMTEGELGRKVHLDSGTLAPLLKRLDKQSYIHRIRPDNNERKLFLSLAEEGEALRERAVSVPHAMEGCIDLSQEELIQLKSLLDKALSRMEKKRRSII